MGVEGEELVWKLKRDEHRKKKKKENSGEMEIDDIAENEKENVTEDNEIGKEGENKKKRKKKKKKKERVDVDSGSFTEERSTELPDYVQKKFVEDNVNGKDKGHKRRDGRKEKKKKKDEVGRETESLEESLVGPGYGRKKIKEDNVTGVDKDCMGKEGKKKNKKRKDKMNRSLSDTGVSNNGKAEVIKEDEIAEGSNERERKKKKKKEREVEDEEFEAFLEEILPEVPDNENRIVEDEDCGKNEGKKKRKKEDIEMDSKKDGKKKKRKKDDTDVESILAGNVSQVRTGQNKAVGEDKGVSEGHARLDKKKEKKNREKEGYGVDLEKDENKMKGNSMERKKTESEKGIAKDKDQKHVKFSGHDEVFPSYSDGDGMQEPPDGKIIHGKRFSPKEDKMIMEGVSKYIKEHNLGEEGLQKIIHCSRHPEVRKCWKEIGSCIPWRTNLSIYMRAHTIYERDNSRKWSSEERDFVLRYAAKYGKKWKEIADCLGKFRMHVKDFWRRNKLEETRKRGKWGQEEYQTLFNLVNKDLQMKASMEKKITKLPLRDNISWAAISDKLATRSQPECCYKWYSQIASPMVKDKLWADIDDYRLLERLYKLDVCCVEEVEWDELLDNRPGHVCLQRWNQLVKHIGENRSRPFMDQVDLLVSRFCPNILNKGNNDEPYSDPEADASNLGQEVERPIS